MNYKVHTLSDVQTESIGENTSVWQYCVIFKNAKIGANCNICSHCLIENEVIIGNNVTVKSGVQIWDGIKIEDNVFIGPNASFTNDLLPRSQNKNWNKEQTILKKFSSIGANATILAGIEIGEYCLIGAGSVVTKSTPAHTVWYGNPARHNGYITKDNVLLDLNFNDAKTGDIYEIINGVFIKKSK